MIKTWTKIFYAYTLRFNLYILNNPSTIYIFVYLSLVLLLILKIAINFNFSYYLSYYEQEYNIFTYIPLEFTPFYTSLDENLIRVTSFTYSSPNMIESPTCSNFVQHEHEHTEESRFISIWEKLFGRGTPSKYKFSPFMKKNTTVLFNEEIINMFKYAFTKENYDFNNTSIEIVNTTYKKVEEMSVETLTKDAKSVSPCMKNSIEIFNDYASISNNIDIGLSFPYSENVYTSNIGIYSYFNDSSSDSDSDSVITAIWKPNPEIPAIVITTPDNVNIKIDSTNFDEYKYAPISKLSSENTDETRLHTLYYPSLNKEAIPDKLRIEEKETFIETNKNNASQYYEEISGLDGIGNQFEGGWDDYFKGNSNYYNIAENSYNLDKKDDIFNSKIQKLEILKLSLDFLPNKDYYTFGPLVLEELYKQYNNNTLDLEDLSKIKSIIMSSTFDNYTSFKSIDPDVYINYVDSLDISRFSLNI